jgi:spore coat protein CotH
MRFVIWLPVWWALSANPAAGGEGASDFFDDSKVQEIRLYFSNSNWYDTLYNSHKSDPEDPYFPVRFKYGTIAINSIGARFKGSSSFYDNSSSQKKSFKLDFNKYDPDATFLGMKKLSLNNFDLEPDFLREKIFLDFASKYIAAIRAVHCRVYVNDVYWGLYLAVEQPDKAMMQDRFGKAEDGNLYSAGDSATLAYLGTNQTSYYSHYTLETNETENDWSDLVQFSDVLNNAAATDLAGRLEPIVDVDNILSSMALNSLFGNVESYGGSASEYYLYQRSDSGRFVFLHWDLNECLGMTIYSTPKVTNPMTMDPFWLPDSAKYGSRPLLTNLWAVDSYKKKYLRQLARMLREGFDETTVAARVTRLANLIRNDVYADTKKFYTNANFEASLTVPVSISIVGGHTTVNGVTQFVQQRNGYLKTLLQSYATASDIRLNELMNVNVSTLTDEAGEFDPWIEICNQGPGALSTSGFYLTDDSDNPKKYALPAKNLADGAFQILWLDNEAGQGTNHANFALKATGGNLFLYYASGGGVKLIDSISYPALKANQSLIRMNNSGAQWLVNDVATAGTENPVNGSNPWGETALLRISEFQAVNKGYLVDPDEPGEYPDWFEIYNPGASTVDMSGMFITDNMFNPTKWKVPQGVTIHPGGYLRFWADADPKQGSLHTNFQLDSDGEELALYRADGFTLIDCIVYPAQISNVSYGRRPDSVNSWSYFNVPTPLAANGLPSSATLEVSSGGSGAASTIGTGAEAQSGYATVSVNSGAAPYGVAIFSYAQKNIIVSEAGIPASPPTKSARVFIDYRSRVEALPGQAAGAMDIYTGIALANTTPQDATLIYTLRRLNGETLATGHGTLAAGAHIARFIHQFSGLAGDFKMPKDFADTIGFGALDIASDRAISITAMRMSVNQRSEMLFTSTPIADLSAASSTATLYFPQIANGGGYITTVALLNTSNANESGFLKLYANSGSALVVTDSNGSAGSLFAYAIPANGAWVFETNGSPATTHIGSMQIIPDSGTQAPVGAGVFRYTCGGITVTEAGIPSAVATTHARIFIDRTSGHDTGVAIAGVNDASVNVSVRAYAMNGSTTASDANTITLSGNGHLSAFAGQLVSGLRDGFTGVLDLESTTPFVALTLRSLYNTRRDYLITTFPVADLTRSAPFPTVFPQIADGGGYTTQFILLSAGEEARATVNLLNEDGASFSVMR